jgi:hypothetical protein
MSIAVAGAGCSLAVLGALIVAGDAGASDGDFNRLPGLVLSALVVAAGLFALAGAERGAIATGGAVAAALGVPPLLFFLTFDENGLPPYSTEGILIVSTVAWLGLYLVGPGRGRPLFLGAGLLGLWATVLQLTEELFDAPYLLFGLFLGFGTVDSSFDDTGSSFGDSGDFPVPIEPDFGSGFGRDAPFHVPDLATIGILSLAFGLAYLLVSRRLDRRGLHGVATPFALATIPTLAIGTIAMTDDLEQVGTGLLMMGIGFGLAYHGATMGRRATTWIGGAATALGAAVLLADLADDGTLVGVLFLAAGVGLVVGGHALAQAIGEPDELEVMAPVVTARDHGGSPWAPPPDVPPPPQPPSE